MAKVVRCCESDEGFKGCNDSIGRVEAQKLGLGIKAIDCLPRFGESKAQTKAQPTGLKLAAAVRAERSLSATSMILLGTLPTSMMLGKGH